MSTLSKRLKEARIRAGLTQAKLGVLAGIDEASASARMNQYERDKHAPDWLTVQRIAEVLGVPVTYFYAEDDAEADLLRRWAAAPLKLREEALATLRKHRLADD